MKCCLMMTWGRYSAPRSLCLSVCRHAVVIAQFVFRLQTSSSAAIFWWSRWPPSHWWHRWHMYTTHIETHIHMHKHTHAIADAHTHTNTHMQRLPFLPGLYSLCLAFTFLVHILIIGIKIKSTPYKGNQIHPDSCFSLSSPEGPTGSSAHIYWLSPSGPCRGWANDYVIATKKEPQDFTKESLGDYFTHPWIDNFWQGAHRLNSFRRLDGEMALNLGHHSGSFDGQNFIRWSTAAIF